MDEKRDRHYIKDMAVAKSKRKAMADTVPIPAGLSFTQVLREPRHRSVMLHNWHPVSTFSKVKGRVTKAVLASVIVLENGNRTLHTLKTLFSLGSSCKGSWKL